MKRKALSMKNKPRSLSLSWYAVVWLLMDRAQPAEWVWGVIGTFCALIFVATLVDFIRAEDVEL
jgi:hypothetical protein